MWSHSCEFPDASFTVHQPIHSTIHPLNHGSIHSSIFATHRYHICIYIYTHLHSLFMNIVTCPILHIVQKMFSPFIALLCHVPVPAISVAGPWLVPPRMAWRTFQGHRHKGAEGHNACHDAVEPLLTSGSGEHPETLGASLHMRNYQIKQWTFRKIRQNYWGWGTLVDAIWMCQQVVAGFLCQIHVWSCCQLSSRGCWLLVVLYTWQDGKTWASCIGYLMPAKDP